MAIPAHRLLDTRPRCHSLARSTSRVRLHRTGRILTRAHARFHRRQDRRPLSVLRFCAKAVSSGRPGFGIRLFGHHRQHAVQKRGLTTLSPIHNLAQRPKRIFSGQSGLSPFLKGRTNLDRGAPSHRCQPTVWQDGGGIDGWRSLPAGRESLIEMVQPYHPQRFQSPAAVARNLTVNVGPEVMSGQPVSRAALFSNSVEARHKAASPPRLGDPRSPLQQEL